MSEEVYMAIIIIAAIIKMVQKLQNRETEATTTEATTPAEEV